LFKNMAEKLTKKLAKELMEIKGEARGVTLKTDWDFIFQRKGIEGLEKLNAKMAEVGFPLSHKEIKTMNFYPIGMDAVSMLAIRDVFGFGEKEFIELGASAPKFSIFLKVLLRYFASPEQALKEAPKMWKKHYTIGELKVVGFDEKDKKVGIRIENFKVHPIYCCTIKGYFTRVLEMIVKSDAKCEEIKCQFRGDEYHEFLLSWE